MPVPDERRQQMLELARQWQGSGMKARAFAKERGVTPWVLYYWRQRLTGRDRPKRRRAAQCVSLARVRVLPDPPDTGDLEIVLVSGDRIRMVASVSVERLRRVVQALRARC